MHAITKTAIIGILGLIALHFVSSRLEGQADEPIGKRQNAAAKSTPRRSKAQPLATKPIPRLEAPLQLPEQQPGYPHPVIPALDHISSPPIPDYKGSVLQIIAPVQGEMAFFQNRFIEKFLHDDPEPASRSAHFSWIPISPKLRRIGWHGAIVGAQPQPDQSVIVTIKIQPWLFSNSRGSVISDFVYEKYLVSGGEFTLIDTDAANSENHFHGFPLGNP